MLVTSSSSCRGFQTPVSETKCLRPAQLSYESRPIKTYFSNLCGVGNQRLLENLNCGLVQDLLKHIDDDENNNSSRIFVSYAQEIMAMLVTLGSFRDTWPLHQHNYAQQQSRNWLASVIAPFAANFVVVRYK